MATASAFRCPADARRSNAVQRMRLPDPVIGLPRESSSSGCHTGRSAGLCVVAN
jgi:hypothetical protein